MQAYGDSKVASGEERPKSRYVTGEDVLQSQDMTIMDKSALADKTLNATTPQGNKLMTMTKSSSNKASEIDGLGRIDTQEDEFDVVAIQRLHANNNKAADVENNSAERKQNENAYGVTRDIFDNSSYGEVGVKNFLNTQRQEGSPRSKGQSKDQSVSLVLMQDSMAFDDVKAMKVAAQANA